MGAASRVASVSISGRDAEGQVGGRPAARGAAATFERVAEAWRLLHGTVVWRSLVHSAILAWGQITPNGACKDLLVDCCNRNRAVQTAPVSLALKNQAKRDHSSIANAVTQQRTSGGKAGVPWRVEQASAAAAAGGKCGRGGAPRSHEPLHGVPANQRLAAMRGGRPSLPAHFCRL